MTPEVALTLPWGYIHVYYHSSQISLLVSQVSGERLHDHWSFTGPLVLWFNNVLTSCQTFQNQRTNGPVNAQLRSAAYTNKHV